MMISVAHAKIRPNLNRLLPVLMAAFVLNVLLPSAVQAYARSVEIWINNKSARPLELRRTGPLRGRWIRHPPNRIPGGAQERIMSVSSSDFTGTEGWAEYVFGDTWGAEKTDVVYIYWDQSVRRH